MATMKLETQKLMLVREIINSDNKEFLQEMADACRKIKHRLASMIEKDSKAASKDEILAELKEAVGELNDYKAGKIQARPAEELARELQMEEA